MTPDEEAHFNSLVFLPDEDRCWMAYRRAALRKGNGISWNARWWVEIRFGL